jgi:hypothetical protein
MTLANESFIDLMNKSPWFGTIIEVGMGIPFQYSFMNVPGASNTIFETKSPYAKEAQNLNRIRSVSIDGVRSFASREIQSLKTNLNRDNLFSLAISASHKSPNEYGESHIWACISVLQNGMHRESFMHISLDKDTYSDRKLAGEQYVYILSHFVLNALNISPISWEQIVDDYKTNGLGKTFRIDVVCGKEFSMADKLKLVMDYNPIIFDKGNLVRIEDVFRKNNVIYRGSFNPPTNAHLIIGGDSIFEISIGSAWKPTINEQDIIHRVNMLSLSDKTVMVSGRHGLFIDFHNMLQVIAPGNYEYIIGIDTFNAVTNPKYIPNEDSLRDFEYGRTGKFLVNRRDGFVINKNKYEEMINYSDHYNIDCAEYDYTSSSTRVRNGELNLCSEAVASYIASNNLYLA